MSFKCGKNTTLSLDISLPSLLPAASVATIVGELWKNLLIQRHQIPQQFELLKKEVDAIKERREREQQQQQQQLSLIHI